MNIQCQPWVVCSQIKWEKSFFHNWHKDLFRWERGTRVCLSVLNRVCSTASMEEKSSRNPSAVKIHGLNRQNQKVSLLILDTIHFCYLRSHYWTKKFLFFFCYRMKYLKTASSFNSPKGRMKYISFVIKLTKVISTNWKQRSRLSINLHSKAKSTNRVGSGFWSLQARKVRKIPKNLMMQDYSELLQITLWTTQEMHIFKICYKR